MRTNHENTDASLKEMKASKEHQKKEMKVGHEALMVIIKIGQEKIRGHDGGLSRNDGGHGFGGQIQKK
jgi:hypothetical protein